MSRTTQLLRLVAALVGIVAIGLAAVTIRSPTGGGSGGTGDGGGGVPPSPPPDQPAGGALPPFLEYLLYALAILVAIALAWYLLVHRREAVRYLAIAFVASAVFGILVYALMRLDLILDSVNGAQSPGLPGSGLPTADGDGALGSSSEDRVDSVPVPLEPVLTIVAAVAVVFVGAVFLSRDADEDATTEAVDPPSDTDRTTAIAATAGRAAERIEATADVENEVYRAWHEMTTLLDVARPETHTPGEFETAAIAAGMDRDHVRELTRLFERVRYGDDATTAAIESRAVAVFERIETEYEDEPDADRRGTDR